MIQQAESPFTLWIIYTCDVYWVEGMVTCALNGCCRLNPSTLQEGWYMDFPFANVTDHWFAHSKSSVFVRLQSDELWCVFYIWIHDTPQLPITPLYSQSLPPLETPKTTIMWLLLGNRICGYIQLLSYSLEFCDIKNSSNEKTKTNNKLVDLLVIRFPVCGTQPLAPTEDATLSKLVKNIYFPF